MATVMLFARDDTGHISRMNLLVVEPWQIVVAFLGLVAVFAAFLLLGNRKVRADHWEARRAADVAATLQLVRSADIPTLAGLVEDQPAAVWDLHAALAALRAEKDAWRSAAASSESYPRLVEAVQLASAEADLDGDLIRARTAGELVHFLLVAADRTTNQTALAASLPRQSPDPHKGGNKK